MRAYFRRVAGFHRDIRLFYVYALLSFLGIGVLSLILNLYLVELGYDEAFIGAVNAVSMLSMGATCVAIGFLINRFGNWNCIVWGTVEFVLATAVLCFMTGGPALLAFSLLSGIGMAIVMTNQMTFIIEWASPEDAPTAAAVSAALNSASTMAGSLLGGLLPGLLGVVLSVDPQSVTTYRWTMLAGVVLTALGLLPLFLMGMVRRQRHHEQFQVAHAQLMNTNARRQTRRDVIAVILLGLLLALGLGTIEPFYNVLLGEHGMRASSIGVVFALSGLVATVSSLGGPWLFRRFGAIASQLVTRLLPIPFHLLLIGFPGAALISVAYMTRRVSGNTAWPIESAHVGSLLPPTARAHAFGLRSASWNFGYAISALIGGWVIARTGSYVPAYLAMTVFCTASVMVYVVAFGSREATPDAQPATAESRELARVGAAVE
jgi:MFS family permease